MGKPLASVELFDPATNTWASHPSLITVRTEHAAVELNGKLYVLGGWTGAGPSATVETTAGLLSVYMLK